MHSRRSGRQCPLVQTYGDLEILEDVVVDEISQWSDGDAPHRDIFLIIYSDSNRRSHSPLAVPLGLRSAEEILLINWTDPYKIFCSHNIRTTSSVPHTFLEPLRTQKNFVTFNIWALV